MGASGSGKSTMLHLLGGLDRPTAGEVVIDGINISPASTRSTATLTRRAKTGFVFQFFNLIPLLNVAENVALPFLIAGDPVGDAIAIGWTSCCDLVGLADKAEHRPDQLSAGEQQRVALARALATEPAILLADEPTGNLDFMTGTEILDLLWDSCDRLGQTIVLVTHDARAAAYADRVLVVRDGEIRDEIELGRRSDHEATAADPAAWPRSGCRPMRLGTLAWRGLLASRLRTALAVIGVALGVAAVTGTIVAGGLRAGARAAHDVAARPGRCPRPRLRRRGLRPADGQAIRAQPGVVAAAPVSERRLTVSTAPGEDERVFTLLVLGVDPDVDATIRRPSLTRGHFALGGLGRPTRSYRPWAAREWAAEWGTRSSSRGGARGCRACGSSACMGDPGSARSSGGNLVVVARSTLDSAWPSRRRFATSTSTSVSAPTEEQIDAVERTLTEPFVVETAGRRRGAARTAQRASSGSPSCSALVALVVGSFLVGNTLAMTLGERTREIGLLRAAGTTSRQVIGIFLRQALALGVVGQRARRGGWASSWPR